MITAAELMKYLNKEAPAWVTLHSYALNEYVTKDGTVYQCIVAHTSGTFSADLTSLYWTDSHFIQVSANYAIKRVNDFCNRDFRSAEYTHEFEGNGSNFVWLNNSPATAISAVTYLDESTGNDTTIFSGSDTAANSVKLFNGSGKIMLLKGYSFLSGVTYKITYTGGYSSGNMPESVKGSCKEIAAIHLKRSDAGQGYLGLTSRNMAGQGTEAAGFNFEQAVQDALKAVETYKIYNV